MAYFVNTSPAPLLNTRDVKTVFGASNGSLPFDKENLVRALEMIALIGTVFEIIKDHGSFILEVRTTEYPSMQPLYLDKRFGKEEKQKPPTRKKNMPAPEVILKRMKDQIGKPYVWGGNYSAGIPQLLKYYPPPVGKTLNALERASWTFQGVDCSGLLYEATDGALPRNTQDLLFVGKSVSISQLSWEEMPHVLQPLDLLIWKGHLVIVFDEVSVIESKNEWGGVCMRGVKERLDWIRDVDRKIPVEDPSHVLQNTATFLVRRFIV